MATPPIFSAGAVLTAAQMNKVGLWLIKSQTVGTAVTSQNVTGCFSADFDNYVVSYSNITASSGAQSMAIKMLVGTTATTNGFYGNTFYVVNAGAGALTNANLVNSAFGECGCITNGFKNASTFDIMQPFLATQTLLTFSAVDNYYWRHGSFVVNNSTSYDGFQLSVGAGTMTGGTISVYGYRQ